MVAPVVTPEAAPIAPPEASGAAASAPIATPVETPAVEPSVAAEVDDESIAEGADESPAPEADVDPLTVLQSVVPEWHLDNLAAQYIGANGEVDFEIEGNALPHEQVIEYVESVRDQLQAHADEFVTSQGVDAQGFYAWLNEQRPREMQSAALVLFHGRGDLSGFAPLLAEYQQHVMRRHATSASRSPSATPEASTGNDRELVTINGLTMERRAAQRAGLL